jgi:hypothetical protein
MTINENLEPTDDLEPFRESAKKFLRRTGEIHGTCMFWDAPAEDGVKPRFPDHAKQRDEILSAAHLLPAASFLITVIMEMDEHIQDLRLHVECGPAQKEWSESMDALNNLGHKLATSVRMVVKSVWN